MEGFTFITSAEKNERRRKLLTDGRTEILRANITLVYEHTICATSAFSMCMLRVVFKVVLF